MVKDAQLDFASAAACLIMGITVLEGIGRDCAEVAVDVLQVMRPGQRQRPVPAVLHLFQIRSLVFLRVVQHVFPFFHGRYIPADRLPENRSGDQHVVGELPVLRDAEIGQGLFRLLGRNRGVGNDRSKFRHLFFAFFGDDGGGLPLPAVFTCVLRGKTAPLLQIFQLSR